MPLASCQTTRHLSGQHPSVRWRASRLMSLREDGHCRGADCIVSVKPLPLPKEVSRIACVSHCLERTKCVPQTGSYMLCVNASGGCYSAELPDAKPLADLGALGTACLHGTGAAGALVAMVNDGRVTVMSALTGDVVAQLELADGPGMRLEAFDLCVMVAVSDTDVLVRQWMLSGAKWEVMCPSENVGSVCVCTPYVVALLEKGTALMVSNTMVSSLAVPVLVALDGSVRVACGHVRRCAGHGQPHEGDRALVAAACGNDTGCCTGRLLAINDRVEFVRADPDHVCFNIVSGSVREMLAGHACDVLRLPWAPTGFKCCPCYSRPLIHDRSVGDTRCVLFWAKSYQTNKVTQYMAVHFGGSRSKFFSLDADSTVRDVTASPEPGTFVLLRASGEHAQVKAIPKMSNVL